MIIPAHDRNPARADVSAEHDFTLIWWGFVLQGAAAAGGMQGQMATFMNERFPTEVRATASGFCYHQGAIWGGLVAPIIAYFATAWQPWLCDPDDDRDHGVRAQLHRWRCWSGRRRRARSWWRTLVVRDRRSYLHRRFGLP